MPIEVNTAPKPKGLDIKNFILTLELIAEVKTALGGLVDYDTVVIPLRKASVQIVLPKETVQIPLGKLFTEETPEERKDAYCNRRFRTFQELAAWGCLSETKFPSRDSENVTLMKGRINEAKFNPIYDRFVEAYPERSEAIRRLADATVQETPTAVREPVPIKKIRLDTTNLLLEINDGSDFISFKSKRGAEGLDKETKAFKVLCHLWDFRHEEKNRKVTSKGEFATLTNIVKSGGGENENAAAKNIQRLNKRFKEKGWAITIDLKDGKARLTIRFS